MFRRRQRLHENVVPLLETFRRHKKTRNLGNVLPSGARGRRQNVLQTGQRQHVSGIGTTFWPGRRRRRNVLYAAAVVSTTATRFQNVSPSAFPKRFAVGGAHKNVSPSAFFKTFCRRHFVLDGETFCQKNMGNCQRHNVTVTAKRFFKNVLPSPSKTPMLPNQGWYNLFPNTFTTDATVQPLAR